MIELGHVTDRKPPFRYAAFTRVAFSDTDAQGVVYYGRYLPYFDLARTEYHRRLGPLATGRSQFVVRALKVEYVAPARFDDLIEVFIRIARVGRTSVTYELAAYRIDADAGSESDGGAEDPEGHRTGDVLMVTAEQTVVLIDQTTRIPLPVPELVRTRVSEFEGVRL